MAVIFLVTILAKYLKVRPMLLAKSDVGLVMHVQLRGVQSAPLTVVVSFLQDQFTLAPPFIGLDVGPVVCGVNRLTDNRVKAAYGPLDIVKSVKGCENITHSKSKTPQRLGTV